MEPRLRKVARTFTLRTNSLPSPQRMNLVPLIYDYLIEWKLAGDLILNRKDSDRVGD